MNPPPPSTAISVRPYQDSDEIDVLSLLSETLGTGPAGARSSEYFRWKHYSNPFGPSFMLIAEAGGQVVGLRAFMRWRFHAGAEVISAVRAVDTATHRAFQGQGVFSRLTREALNTLGDRIDLVFNTPNDKSLRGYLRLGWRTVGKIPISVRVRRPLAFLAGHPAGKRQPRPARPKPHIHAASAAELIQEDRSINGLLAEAETDPLKLRTARDVAYLRWRYGWTPLDYRAVADTRGGRLRGLAVFRVRPRGRLWESTVTEVIVPTGDHGTAERLLSEVIAAARVDHLTCSFPRKSAGARAARRRGFLRAPGGMLLVGYQPRQMPIDVTELSAWGLSLGDLEVF